MARTKPPVLRCSDAVSADCHPAMCECVAARVRALEAVARAAGRLATYLQTAVPADEWMPVDAAIVRACERLERLSARASREER